MKLYLVTLLLVTLLIGSIHSKSSCQYDKASGSCAGSCGVKGVCCIFAFGQLTDGTPLCSSKAQ